MTAVTHQLVQSANQLRPNNKLAPSSLYGFFTSKKFIFGATILAIAGAEKLCNIWKESTEDQRLTAYGRTVSVTKMSSFLAPHLASSSQSVSDCLSAACSDIGKSVKGSLIPPEWENVQEFFRFRKDDPRDKFLYLMPEDQAEYGLNPTDNARLLTQLSSKYDVKYQPINSFDKICEAVNEGAKAGKLTHLLIGGKGTPDEIVLSNQLNGRISKENNFSNCFSKLEPYAKIILLGSSTGYQKADSRNDNIAQIIADRSKRIVIASDQDIYSDRTNLLPTKSTMFYSPRRFYYNLSYLPFSSYLSLQSPNAFLRFNPYYSDCPRYEKKEGDSTEMFVAKTITKDQIKKFILPKESEKNFHDENELVFCKDDLRDKVLFLSGDLRSGVWNPENIASTLGHLSDKFDIKYTLLSSGKQMRSSDQLCKEVDKEIKEASTYGKVAALFIESFADSDGNLVLGEQKWKKFVEKVTTEENFSRCFSKLDKEAAIFLFESSGEDEKNKIKIAEAIASKANRVVVIGKCPKDEHSIKMPSQSSQMVPETRTFLKHYLEMNCPESDNSYLT